jgi:aldehyde:ferredoxin oxidoreductase
MNADTLFGYTGKILHVDLSRDTFIVEEPKAGFYRKYMGGSALGAYYVLRHTPVGVDPLKPGNTLVFALSAPTGAPIPGQSRMTIVAKSPLTDVIGDSQCGGFFPAEMKFSGFDAVVIHGQSKSPVYLWLYDGKAELRPAHHLSCRLTGEVEDLIRQELGEKKIKIAQCGPAGERLVRFGSVMNESNRACGRTGMGAVMGSKNLKAIAVLGNTKPALADKEELHKLARWGAAHLEESDLYSTALLGTAGIVESQNSSGGLPTRNWKSGSFEGWKSLDGRTLNDTILQARDTCYACSVRCKRIVEVTDGPYRLEQRYGGPEYETLATFGSYCGIDDLVAVSYANQLCNMYGMDTISCGATIAWAMECFESGLIDKEDTGGLELNFGNSDAMIATVDLIATRTGLGDILAEGSAKAAKVIGRGSEALLVTGKNMEYPAHMPQIKRSLVLIYTVNPFGADHMSHAHDPTYRDYPERMKQLGLDTPQPDNVLNREKVHFALTTQFLHSCLDTLNLCQFVFGPSWQLFGPDQIVEVVRAITGWDVSIDELLEVGERRLNLLRAFNAREGFDRAYDTLPKKLQMELNGGVSEGLYVSSEEVEQAMDWYFSMAGWDVTTGVPGQEKLEELGLGWILDNAEEW